METGEGDATQAESRDVLLQSDTVDDDRAADTAENDMKPEDNGE